MTLTSRGVSLRKNGSYKEGKWTRSQLKVNVSKKVYIKSIHFDPSYNSGCVCETQLGCTRGCTVTIYKDQQQKKRRRTEQAQESNKN